MEFYSFPEDEAETTVGQTDAEGTLVNRNVPRRTTQAPDHELFVHPQRFAPATFDVGLGRAARSSEEKCGLIHATAPRSASCRLNPKTTSRSPQDGCFLCRRQWETCIHVLSALFSHPIPMSRHMKNTARAALPCPVQSVLLPADALHVPVRVHEGPCQYVFMKVRAHQKPPIPPATNLVSRRGGSGNGLGQELPVAKAVAELVHQTPCRFRVKTEGTTCIGPMKLPPDWGFFSTNHALMGITTT